MRFTLPIILCTALSSVALNSSFAEDYLTKEGKLAHELKLVQLQSGFAGQTGTQWQIRDNSEGAAVHLRMSRSVSLAEAQTAVSKTSTGGFDVGTISVRADDWLIARHYTVRVVVSPSAPGAPPGTPTGTDATSQQLAQAILAGITYDYFVSLPGVITATNGVPGDNSRLVWHLDLTAGSERVLTAESIYPDWPRLVLLLVVFVLLGSGIVFRSRGKRPVTPEPPIFTTPTHP